jgi:hypothetical protein
MFYYCRPQRSALGVYYSAENSGSLVAVQLIYFDASSSMAITLIYYIQVLYHSNERRSDGVFS